MIKSYKKMNNDNLCKIISIKLDEDPIEDLELLKYLDKEKIHYRFDKKEENLLLNFNINTKNFLNSQA